MVASNAETVSSDVCPTPRSITSIVFSYWDLLLGCFSIIDEVTKSIKNDNRVWYSREIKTWIRMQWPNGLDNAGVLVVSDDEDKETR